MIFDPQEGYVDTGFRRTYMPCVSVYDHASKEMIQVRLNEAYRAGVAIAELNVTPITKELLDAVKHSLNPFVYIASFTYQAAQLAPQETESAERFYQYLARVVTVYLKSHGYYMPDTIYPLFIEAIATTSATRIDKVIKGLHTQIGISSLKKYLNSYVQLNEGQINITSNKRIAPNDASTIAEQLNVTDVDKAPKNNENEDG